MGQTYRLASRQHQPNDTVFSVGPVTFGNGGFVIIAGPCAVESEEQILRIAKSVKEAGAQMLRGGAFKPRSSPYSFQGLGLEGLKFLKTAREATGLPVVTEAIDLKTLEMVYEYSDMIQIGARNMQNFSLLREVGKLKKPVLLKRNMAATVDEWLMAAEYILDSGNSHLLLCERGIRGFDAHTRYFLDLGAIPVVKHLSHLPIGVDPSHASGKREHVIPLTRAALAVGASFIMMDVHDRADEALCDGRQAIGPSEFEQAVLQLKQMSQSLQVRI